MMISLKIAFALFVYFVLFIAPAFLLWQRWQAGTIEFADIGGAVLYFGFFAYQIYKHNKERRSNRKGGNVSDKSK